MKQQNTNFLYTWDSDEHLIYIIQLLKNKSLKEGYKSSFNDFFIPNNPIYSFKSTVYDEISNIIKLGDNKKNHSKTIIYYEIGKSPRKIGVLSDFL